MKRQFFSGSTMEQAILAAARHYGLEPEQVAYQVRRKKHGFLNARRRVVIEVDPSAPKSTVNRLAEKQHSASAGIRESDELVPPREACGQGASGLLSGRWQGEEMRWVDEESREGESVVVDTVVGELIALLDRSLVGETSWSEEGFEVVLSGAKSGVLIDGKGRVLDAFEHLLPRLVRSLVGESSPFRVDCGGFRERREMSLKEMAEKTASRVVETSRSELLEPMTPAERRLVHLALAEEPTVRTQSEGSGFLKRVRIDPT